MTELTAGIYGLFKKQTKPVTVETGADFLLEKKAQEWQLEGWKAALRWFSREARKQPVGEIAGHLEKEVRQDLLGHAHIENTQIYLHVMQKPGIGVKSPLDG